MIVGDDITYSCLCPLMYDNFVLEHFALLASVELSTIPTFSFILGWILVLHKLAPQIFQYEHLKDLLSESFVGVLRCSSYLSW